MIKMKSEFSSRAACELLKMSNDALKNDAIHLAYKNLVEAKRALSSAIAENTRSHVVEDVRTLDDSDDLLTQVLAHRAISFDSEFRLLNYAEQALFECEAAVIISSASCSEYNILVSEIVDKTRFDSLDHFAQRDAMLRDQFNDLATRVLDAVSREQLT